MKSEHLFLIFGEDENDRRSISNLIYAILSDRSHVRTKTLRRPIILRKDASKKKTSNLYSEMASHCRAHDADKRKVILVVHRDCDRLEPAHIAEKNDIVSQCSAQSLKNVIAAVPAWEIETWWMLFPEALRATRPCWEKIDFSGREIGRIENSKEILTKALRERKGKKIAKKENVPIMKNRMA